MSWWEIQSETSRGAARLLEVVATIDDEKFNCAVLTTDPGLWISQTHRESILILDLSIIVGPNRIHSSTEMLVTAQLQKAGWPTTSIHQNYRPSSKSPFVVDLALTSSANDLVVVIETVETYHRFALRIAQVREIAKILRVQYALLTNGQKIVMIDMASNSTMERTTFPTPKELGLDLPAEPTIGIRGKKRIDVVRCSSFNDIVQTLEKYDCPSVIVDHTMPFGLGTETEGILPKDIKVRERADFGTSLLASLSSVSSVQTLVGIVPQGVCFRTDYAKLRDYVQHRMRLFAIIDLPGEALVTYTSIGLTLVALSAHRTSGAVLFSTHTSRGDLIDVESQPWFTDLKDSLHGQIPRSSFLAIIQQGERWTPREHSPKAIVIQEQLQRLGEVITLGKACDIRQGYQHSRIAVAPPRGIPVVRGRDLANEPTSIDDLTRFEEKRDPPNIFRVRNGDVLVQRVGSTPHVLVVSSGLAGAIASDTVLIIRPTDDRLSSHSICEFLLSPIGQGLLASSSQTTTAPTLSVSSLRTLPVPILPKDLARSLDELAEIEFSLRSRADKLRSLKLDLFGADSTEDLIKRVSSIRQISRATSESLHQAESSEFQVRNLYPFPIAFGYRSLAGLISPQEKYRDQLRLVENILAFTSSIALASIDPEDRKDLGVNLLEFWRGGISPGHWRETATAASKILRNYHDHPLASSLSRLWDAKKSGHFAKEIDSLIRAKNDYKHDRGPSTDLEYDESVRDVGRMLDEIISSISFFVEHPLRLVRDVSPVRGSRAAILDTIKFTGDNPALIHERHEYPEALPKNDLYIEISSSRWVSVFPFISVYDCSLCKTRETYFIDKWTGGDKSALVKSFERGHTEEKIEIGKALAHWTKMPAMT